MSINALAVSIGSSLMQSTLDESSVSSFSLKCSNASVCLSVPRVLLDQLPHTNREYQETLSKYLTCCVWNYMAL